MSKTKQKCSLQSLQLQLLKRGFSIGSAHTPSAQGLTKCRARRVKNILLRILQKKMFCQQIHIERKVPI